MNFDITLFRASGIGNLMTEPKLKADKEAGNLSEGAKTNLIDIYVSNKYGRNTDIQNRYISKGLMVEEEGITLYSRVKKNIFFKNEEHLSNQFLKGTPDLFTGKDIHHAESIIDIKCSWDIFTFFRVFTKDINSIYYYQLQAYMALTGAKSAKLAYCLIDTPDTLIQDEKRKLMYKMNCVTNESEEYLKACEELEKSMLYPDIPMKEKLIEFEVLRDDKVIENMYAKIIKARQFLNELEESISPLVGLLAIKDKEVAATIIEALQ